MSESVAGTLLVASPVLIDPNFFRTVVLVLQHDEEGAVGVILNRPSASQVSDHLAEWAVVACEPPVVFVGGPVEPAVAICLASSGAQGEIPVIEGVWVVDVGEGPGDISTARIFSGYAGWAAGQLEAELAEGSWIVVDAEPADAFVTNPDALWSDVLRRQRGSLRLLASYPPDPSLN